MRKFLVAVALGLAACSTTLERGLTEPQADEIARALGEHGIGATKEAERGGDAFSILVAEGDVASALTVMRDEGLPRRDAAGTAEAYAEPSLIPTAGEERARRSAAIAADLARSIEAMPGVHDARVHVGMIDPSVVAIDDEPAATTASVLVRTRDGAHVDEGGVRTLVVGAVPGLRPENVGIVVTALPTTTANEPLVPVGPLYVTQGSATALRAVLAAMLAVNVLLAIALVVVARRKR